MVIYLKWKSRHMHLELPGWSPDVRKALNDLVDNPGEKPYVVTDFDNSTSIFDIEHQLAVWQLRTMAFAVDPDHLRDALSSDISECEEYSNLIDDICAAYSRLYFMYGPFDGSMLADQVAEGVRNDPQWTEFAVKMRYLFSIVNKRESMAAMWLLYWFSGMTPKQVYDVAYASHTYYRSLETVKRTMSSPSDIISKAGVVEVSWTDGIQVTAEVCELWKVLKASGFDIWVCSASGVVQVQAAIDAFGLHDVCSGIYGMTVLQDEDGRYGMEPDYKARWYVANPDGTWSVDGPIVGSLSRGQGKVDAIVKGLVPRYGYGPSAAFVDSTGDFHFATMFTSMRVVVCYNRLLAPTDAGGLIAATALYEKEVLGYDLAKAGSCGDTLYVLQGRDENGLRTLSSSPSTLLLGASEPATMHPDTAILYGDIVSSKPSVSEIFSKYCVKGSEIGTIPVGFVAECTYRGYHSI